MSRQSGPGHASPSRNRQRGARDRRTLRRLLAAAAAGLVGVAAVYGLFVRTTTGQLVDELAWSNSPTAVDGFTAEVSARQRGVALGFLAGGAAAVALVCWRRRRGDLLLAAVVLVTGAWLTTRGLKAVLPRPALTGADTDPSFPSGHTAAAAAMAAALLLAAGVRRRILTGVVATAAATAMGLYTLHAGWHRMSDAIAAFMVAGAWFCVVTAALLVRHGRRPRAITTTDRRVRGAVMAVAAAVAAGATGGLLRSAAAVRNLTGEPSAADASRAYTSGTWAVVATGLLFLAITLWLIVDLDLDPAPRPAPGRDLDTAIGSGPSGN